jgi:hypothetical protein
LRPSSCICGEGGLRHRARLGALEGASVALKDAYLAL